MVEMKLSESESQLHNHEQKTLHVLMNYDLGLEAMHCVT